jgi:IclR family transcriptional regulator, acetate operon repressor
MPDGSATSRSGRHRAARRRRPRPSARLRLLALLAREGRAMSLAELSRPGPAQGHAPAVRQLQDSGHLPATRRKQLQRRPGAAPPGLDTLNHGVVRGLRHEVLAALVTRGRRDLQLHHAGRRQVLYLDRVEAQWPLRLTLDVGSHVPLHCTASGKLFLAEPAGKRSATR